MRSTWIFFLLGAMLTLQCKEDKTENRRNILVGGIPMTVEINDSPVKRTRGLMFRDRLDWNEGMLFVFEREDTLSFWMRNTSIPLSIAFVNKEGVIIDIQDMRPFDQTAHKSRGSALYALEVNKGWFETNGVEAGDSIFVQLD